MFLEGVHCACDETGLCSNGDADGIDWVFDRAVRARFGTLSGLGSRRVLPLGKTINTVIEEQDIDVDITSKCMQEMVATNRQGVAVTGGDPDLQIGPGAFEAGSQRGGTSVNRVNSISIHVIREAAGATDTGKENDGLARNSQFGQHLLDLGQDCIVTASWTPAYCLIRGKITTCQLDWFDRRVHDSNSSTLSSISAMVNGLP